MRLDIAGKRFTHFDDYEVVLTFNAIASHFRFLVQHNILKDLMSYPLCEIHNDEGDLLIKGMILPPTLRSSPKPEKIEINGYSSCGVLEDCQIPVDLYPLQFDGMSLAEITKTILSKFPFDFTYSSLVRDDILKPYDKIESKPDQTIKEFLTELAVERNIILSNYRDGRLFYTRMDAHASVPVGTIDKGMPGIRNMTLQISGQELHSPIFIIAQAEGSESGDSTQYKVDNPYVSAYRPRVVVAEAGDEFDAEKFARSILGKELANIKLTFESSKYYRMGKVLLIRNPDLMIDDFTEFFIQEVRIKGSSQKKDNYIYTCVLKDVYTNAPIKNIFK